MSKRSKACHNKSMEQQQKQQLELQKEKQMRYGSVHADSLSDFLMDMINSNMLSESEVFVDIGSGPGEVLDYLEMEQIFPTGELWGVEMNESWRNQTSARWREAIEWAALENISTQRGKQKMNRTSVAYMYDLCLKRLFKKGSQVDPHGDIQKVLLDVKTMPALKYFISTYTHEELLRCLNASPAPSNINGGCRNSRKDDDSNSPALTNTCYTWSPAIHEQRLACSTGSYTFYVYQRIPTDLCSLSSSSGSGISGEQSNEESCTGGDILHDRLIETKITKSVTGYTTRKLKRKISDVHSTSKDKSQPTTMQHNTRYTSKLLQKKLA